MKGFTHVTRTPFGGPNAENFRPTHSGASKMAHRRVPGLCRLDASSSLSELLPRHYVSLSYRKDHDKALGL